MNIFSQITIIIGTYIVALILLSVGEMNPFVVALLPCIAVTLSTIITKASMRKRKGE